MPICEECNKNDVMCVCSRTSPKQRRIPFNSQAPAAETLESIGSQLTNGATEQAKTPGRGESQGAAKYYSQVQSNITHSGKTLF